MGTKGNQQKQKSGNAPLKDLNDIEKEPYIEFPLVKINFILMGIAGVMIIAGFLLMLGSSSGMDHFNPDIFSTRRIVVGPTIAFLGFVFMAYGIIYRPRSKK